MRAAAALLPLVLFAPPARDSSGAERALLEAARRGDVAGTRNALRAGADPNAASPSGWTPLHEAVQAGQAGVALALLDGGARIDARDRRAGTALDVAQRSGRADLVALLRGRGAQGSGKSVGDRVCVQRWAGADYCGGIEAVEGNRLQVRLQALQGCGEGCAADPDCSGGRSLGTDVRPGDALWIRTWCVTRTFPGSGAAGGLRP